MKCPKCGYLGFERVDRCRNCGYDFSFTSTANPLELALKNEESSPLLDDLAFLDAALSPEPVRVARAVSEEPPRKGGRAMELGAPPELPLFGDPIPDDLPLITKASPPRSPLAVRRATPDIPRLRSATTRATNLDLGLEPVRRASTHAAAGRSMAKSPERSGEDEEDAPIAARFVAVLTDLLILSAIDAAVIYFTLQVCGIGIDEIGILPWAPLLAFFLVQNGGYLVAFTAGGQTLGKLLAGIRVVSTEPRSPLDLGRAFVRELVWLVLAVPAGLGLLTVFSRDRRGVHDRFAGTRVIRG